MTFAALTGRANRELLIGCERKLKFRQNMTNNAISGMAKVSVPATKVARLLEKTLGRAAVGENQ
jgi:hypothetical protein